MTERSGLAQNVKQRSMKRSGNDFLCMYETQNKDKKYNFVEITRNQAPVVRILIKKTGIWKPKKFKKCSSAARSVIERGCGYRDYYGNEDDARPLLAATWDCLFDSHRARA